jgi:RNA polymerase sigma-70 factor (ECF subfamily)
VNTVAEAVWRDERAAVVATLARRLGDLALAEDATQEALAAAAARWPAAGVPDRPGAWLMTAAWRNALDMLRRERAHRRDPREWGAGVEPALPAGDSPPAAPSLEAEDDLLTLVLTCCHPALAPEARVALTLRHVAGRAAAQIAAAFLVTEPTMTKRLVRARAKIKRTGIRFTVPEPRELADRMAAVHAVVYLVFSEGYHASAGGPPVRPELCDEAIWLARQLHRLMPGDRETVGLLALMLLQHARSDARTAADGSLLNYARQDRSRWDGAAIEEARRLLGQAGRGALGPYQVQAAIALLHAVAPAPEAVDWARVADLHGVLSRIAPSPVSEVNRAVAVGRADGPRSGLAVLAPILRRGDLAGYPPLHAAHADLLERAGERERAQAAWELAAELTANPAQRAELQRRAQSA